MSHHRVSIRELSGWGFDDYEYRPKALISEVSSNAADIVGRRSSFEQANAVLAPETEMLRDRFESYARREDLLSEMSGLTWSMGVVDLRTLVAFQRRLSFDPSAVSPSVPTPGDWPALLELSFGSPKPVDYETVYDRSTKTVMLRSSNPNLHLRVTTDPTHPLVVHGGGPFFEVARLRDRWFLRDGYHRAYALLRAQIFAVPAVIVEAETIEELGADQPWFFLDEVLFSTTPPKVVDFLNENLVLQYDRQPLIKTIRIKMEEALKAEIFTEVDSGKIPG